MQSGHLVAPPRRYTRHHRCPICGGYDDPYRREGRCWGFFASNGDFAYCTNVPNGSGRTYGESGAYSHLLAAPCDCGVDHAHERPAPTEPEEVGMSEVIDILDWNRPDMRYDYQRADGSYLLSVLRWNVPGGGKIIRQGVQDGGIWHKNLAAAGVEPPYPLYHVGDVLSARGYVFVVEGERCADALGANLNTSVATTSLGGSGGAHRTDWTPVMGRKVVILPDNDEPGRKYGEAVAQCCLAAGAASVKVIQLCVPERGDVVDWLQAGHSPVELYGLIAEAPESPRLRVLDPVLETVGPVWEEPIDFGSYNLPPFPVETLPAWARTMVAEVARNTQTPPDLASLLFLAVVSTAVGGKLTVWPWAGKKDEPLSLFMMCVMEPATRKSPVFRLMTAPLDVWEDRETERLAEEISQAEAKKDALELNLKHAKDVVAKALPGDERRTRALEAVGQIQREIDELVIPHARQVIADETTPEALVRLIRENNGRMALLSEEGDALDIIAGRYSGGEPRLSVYKKGYDGGTLRVNRVGRAEIIRRPSLTIGITPQHSVLRSLGKVNKLRGEGLLDRFIFSIPEDYRGRRNNDQEAVPDGVLSEYEKYVIALMDLPVPDHESDPDAGVIRFSEEALRLYRRFEDEYIEPSLLNPEYYGRIPGWAGKYAGKVARIAALLHVSELIGQHARPWEVPISVKTLKKAIAIGVYVAEHAKAAFGLMEQELILDDAKKVLDWLIEHVNMEAKTQFTLHDAWFPFRGKYKKVEEFSPIVELLEEYRYIRVLSPEEIADYYHAHVKRGRKPAAMIEVNPLWMERALVKASKPRADLSEFTDWDSDDDSEYGSIQDGGLLTL